MNIKKHKIRKNEMIIFCVVIFSVELMIEGWNMRKFHGECPILDNMKIYEEHLPSVSDKTAEQRNITLYLSLFSLPSTNKLLFFVFHYNKH